MTRTRFTRIDTSKVSAATGKVWEDMDKVWDEVDKVFVAAEEILNHPPVGMNNSKSTVNKLHFEARNKKERWQMFRRFFMMSWKALFTGEVYLTYKKRS